MTKRTLTNRHHELTLIWAVLALTLALSGPATAQTFQYQTIDIKRSTSTYVTGINDSGVMVANYTDAAGTNHCVTINGKTITHLADPNENGTGPGTGTTCWSINNTGQIVGTYTIPNQNKGFLYSGGTYTDVLPPSAAYTIAYGLNNNGDIVGSFQDTVGQHGFLYNGSGYQTLDVPGASFTLAIGINDGGEITLNWGGTDGNYQSATLIGGTYTTLNVPGDMQSQANAINVQGQIVYAGQDAAGVWHGYLYQNGTFTQFDATGANLTWASGINSTGDIVGWYNPGTSSLPVGFNGGLAQIATLSPNSGNTGQTLQVTITGANTHFRRGSTQASFGAGISVGGAADGQPGPVTVHSPTSATADLTINGMAATGSQTVTATTGTEEASLVNGFTILPAVPTLTVLYNFPGRFNGTPVAGVVIGSGGVLYGTAQSGGHSRLGSVFSLAPPRKPSGTWSQTTLHTFTGPPSDGEQPSAAVLIGSGGVLYGTTYYGGNSKACGGAGCGTVFSLTPPNTGRPWTETLLHQFSGPPGDGNYPYSSMVMDSSGVLYGTTYSGGSGPCANLGGIGGCGIVFSLTPPTTPGGTWTEAVLHNFTGGSDGAGPSAGLTIGSGGVLYGMTEFGGNGPCTVTNVPTGCGTVFSLTPPASPGEPWIETVLYNFLGGSDGAIPTTSVILIGSGGVLYGTTEYGGNGPCTRQSGVPAGCGTVFSLTPPASPGGAWTEIVLHAFTGSPSDGQFPVAGVVIGSGGVLYGTTEVGGGCCGTVFTLTPPTTPGGPWTEAVLYNFANAYNGINPVAPLVIDSTGLIFGTTLDGGTSLYSGVVFSLTP